MIKKTIKQTSKQNINDQTDFTIIYEYVPTEDAEERTRSIYKIVNNFIKKHMVCYCFGYSEVDIEQDVIKNNGNSTILARINTSKKEGTCRCNETNPSGKCCLVDVHRVVDRARERLKQVES